MPANIKTTSRRLYLFGWHTAACNGTTWAATKPVADPRDELHHQLQPPVALHNALEPRSSCTPKVGVLSFDLGQNSSTMPKITVVDAAASEVIIRHAKIIDAEGFVSTPGSFVNEVETDVYPELVLAGTGESNLQGRV